MIVSHPIAVTPLVVIPHINSSSYQDRLLPVWKRTVIFMCGAPAPGQFMYERGGFDLGYAKAMLGIDCVVDKSLCAIPVTHNILNGDPARVNEQHLDRYGAEANQGSVHGSPLIWTTNNASNLHNVGK